MFSCLCARGFRKTGVTSVICHKGSEEFSCPAPLFFLVGSGVVELGELVGFHLLRRAADYDKAPAVAGADSLEAQFCEGSAYVDGTQLLADAGTDDLQGSCHGHELANLAGTGSAEIQVHQFPFETGCLELSVMSVQLLDFFFLKPVLEAAFVEGVGFGINGIVVEGVLPWGDDALCLEGQPTAVACRVGEELRVVACSTEGGYMLAVLMIVGVSGSLVDARHRDNGLELVQLGRAHCVEFLAAHQGILGEGEEVVLAHAVGVGLCIEVLLQFRREEVVEPGGLECSLFAYQHKDDVVDGGGVEPAGYHGDEPLLQISMPSLLFVGTTFDMDGICQFLNRMLTSFIREIRVNPCETLKILLEGVEGRNIVGLDDAIDVLLVDAGYRGHFCPKGVDTAIVDWEPLIFLSAVEFFTLHSSSFTFKILNAGGDFIVT